MTSTTAPGPVALERARVVVAVVFFVNGLAFASWISRLPAVRDGLALSPAEVGLLLLCLSAGSVVALPASGPVVHRVGPARAVLGGAVGTGAGLLLVALGVTLTSVPLTGVGLVTVGLSISSWDVAMNVEGADVERRLGRTLMPRLHAGFSLGTVAGAGLGAACAATGVPVEVQLGVTSVAVPVVAAVAVRSFLPVQADHDRPGSLAAHTAWRERRTLLVGVLVLAFALTEGVANDWLALSLIDGYGTSDAVGALGYALFVSAMTLARTLGGGLLETYGRVPVLRATAALALAGLLLVVLGPTLPFALAGALLWGLGASLGFPVGMSAASDDPEGAAVRVSVVSSIGYTAFLGGPPLVGLLAEELGQRRSLLVVVVALVVALALAAVARPAAPAATVGAGHGSPGAG